MYMYMYMYMAHTHIPYAILCFGAYLQSAALEIFHHKKPMPCTLSKPIGRSAEKYHAARLLAIPF